MSELITAAQARINMALTPIEKANNQISKAVSYGKSSTIIRVKDYDDETTNQLIEALSNAGYTTSMVENTSNYLQITW